jgi:hypothetical protein
MVQRRRGRIISTGSTASFVGLPRQVHYVAAKNGIVGFSKAFAIEMAEFGITVNVVCPGAIDTPMVAGLGSVPQSDRLGSLPQLLGPPNLFDPDAMLGSAEITSAMLWLASDAANTSPAAASSWTPVTRSSEEAMEPTDVTEIHQLLSLYGHAVDRVDPGLIALVFSEDAVFDATPCGLRKYAGRAAIVEWFELGKPPHPPFHVSSNFYVFEDGGEVKAWSKWLTTNAETGTMRGGDYEDVLERTADGWRIRERVASVRFVEPNFAARTGAAYG